MNVRRCSFADDRQRCSCLAKGWEAETFPACFARTLQFPFATEKIFILSPPPPTQTQTVILMAARRHCNVVQEEEEVTGRHSMWGGGGLVSDVLCPSPETYLRKSEARIGMTPREDLARRGGIIYVTRNDRPRLLMQSVFHELVASPVVKKNEYWERERTLSAGDFIVASTYQDLNT